MESFGALYLSFEQCLMLLFVMCRGTTETYLQSDFLFKGLHNTWGILRNKQTKPQNKQTNKTPQK